MSLAYELKCFSILEKVRALNHEDIGRSLSNIGQCYDQLNEFKVALDYYKQTLIIYEQCLPFWHSDRTDTKMEIEELSQKVVENITQF